MELLLSSVSVTPSGTYLFGLVESISSNLDASGSLEDELRLASDVMTDSFCLSARTGREALRVVETCGVLLTPVVATGCASIFKIEGKLSGVLLLARFPGLESVSPLPLRGEDGGLGLFRVAKNLSASNLVLSRVACSLASFLLAASVLGLAVGSVCFTTAGVRRGLEDVRGSTAGGDWDTLGTGEGLAGLVGSSRPELAEVISCFVTLLEGRVDLTTFNSLWSELPRDPGVSSVLLPALLLPGSLPRDAEKLPSWRVLSVTSNPPDSLAMEGVGMKSRVPSSSGEGESVMADTSGKTRVEVSLEGLQYWEGSSESIPLDGLGSVPGEAPLVVNVGTAAVEVSVAAAGPLFLVESSFFAVAIVAAGVAEREEMLLRSSFGIWNWAGKGVCTVTTGVRSALSVPLLNPPSADAAAPIEVWEVSPRLPPLATRVLSSSPSLVALMSGLSPLRLGLARGCAQGAVGSLGW